MKYFLVFLFLLGACKYPSAFITPNEVHREKVELQFGDKTRQTGIVNIFHENYNSIHSTYKESIQFTPEGKDTAENISLRDIDGYWYHSDYYALKLVDINLNNIYHLLFVKRLTPENSRIQLYELYESGSGNATGESRYTYYISIPTSGPLETIGSRSKLLMPGFNEKMSLIVEDCPILAQKILAKDKGYSIALTSFRTKQDSEVLMRIINEYNSCHTQKSAFTN